MKIDQIDTKKKRNFLMKLLSGKFTLKPDHNKQEPKSFELLEDGSYQCADTGENLTLDEIETLSCQYDFTVALVATPGQVIGIEPPDGYRFVNVNYPEGELDTLLIPKQP